MEAGGREEGVARGAGDRRIKADFAGKKIKNKAALFNKVIQNLAEEHKIAFELERPKRPLPSPALSAGGKESAEGAITNSDSVREKLEQLKARKELFSFPQ